MIVRQFDQADPDTAGPVVEWEEPDCLLCGGRRWTTIVEAPDCAPAGTGLWFAVVQCLECGLCFTNPRPSATSISQFYPGIYNPHHNPGSHRRRKVRFLRLPWPRPQNERHTLTWHGQGRLLDFGCGSGSYLERMAQQGWQVTGIDTARAAVARVRETLGLRALLGTLPHPALRPESFDVITMWQALEHVHRPQEVLAEAYRLLAPDGQLLVAVPNIDSLPYRWFGAAWSALDLPRHLTHFAPWTLHLMLEQVGYTVRSVRMLRHAQWMRTSADFSARRRGSPRWHRLLSAKVPSRLATWYSYLTTQSDAMLVTATR